MDNSIYEVIKAALATGKNPAEVVSELGSLVARAEDELKPKTPVRDAALDPGRRCKATNMLITDSNGTIDEYYLIKILCAYLCQHGVEPDNFAATYDEFRELVGAGLKSMTKVFKGTRAVKSGDVKWGDYFGPFASIFDTFFNPLRPDGSKGREKVYNDIR